jgi:hypothetical protein
MTTFALKLIITREINKLNRTIDRKIAAGQSYKQEAALHRQLLRRLNSVNQQKAFALL